MSWPINPRPAKALMPFRRQINALAPNRSVSSEGAREFGGMIAGDAHLAQAPKSDHNANPAGVVTATDITNDPAHGINSRKLAQSILDSKDDRVQYVISNGQIASGPGQSHPQGVWRQRNKGAGDHTEHMHMSLRQDAKYYDDDRPWVLPGFTKDVVKPDPGAPPQITEPLLKRGDKGEAVRKLQQLLFVDGEFGKVTEVAVKAFQAAHGLVVDGEVGTYTWRALLDKTATVVPPVVTDDGTWNTNITASVFGGTSEVERSAYDEHRISESELAVSLPYRFPAGQRRKVQCRNSAGKVVTATIEDVGPWYTDDPYWRQRMRPLAEQPGPVVRGPNKGRIPNKAGIDLSPALARALGVNGLGKIDWRFEPAAPAAKSASAAVTSIAPAAPSPSHTGAVTEEEIQAHADLGTAKTLSPPPTVASGPVASEPAAAGGFIMNLTLEDFQRYLRVALQWIAGALVSYGLIAPDATWVAPAIGMAMTVGSFLWTLYGNRVQAKVNEVAKLQIEEDGKVVKLVDEMKVNSVAVAAAAPANVTPSPIAILDSPERKPE